MVTCEGSYCGALGWIHGRHTGCYAYDKDIMVDLNDDLLLDWIGFTITIC